MAEQTRKTGKTERKKAKAQAKQSINDGILQGKDRLTIQLKAARILYEAGYDYQWAETMADQMWKEELER